MRCAIIVTVMLSSGCGLFFDDGGSGGEVCDLATEPAIAPAPLRDPGTLLCQSFGSGCNPECGPCPAVADLAPIPSWNICGHACEGLTESACAADPACRVVKDAICAIHADCLTDYIGCFPTDTIVDHAIDCFAADAWECSRSNACTAMHELEVCTTDAECARPFSLCVPEGEHPGSCWEQAVCDVPTPPCPSGTTPGISGGCYTGACIPLSACEPM
jgi:hypothetical protein